ncbi:MAG TPA: hypothetical protein VEI49_11320, partial [Terriglobales bacterium]|nr:hypothetical protein [Terriglobales bacterium]
TDAGGSMQSEDDRIGLERVRSVEDFLSRVPNSMTNSGVAASLGFWQANASSRRSLLARAFSRICMTSLVHEGSQPGNPEGSRGQQSDQGSQRDERCVPPPSRVASCANLVVRVRR